MHKLSPSDFAYTWVDCKHCYYQKVKYGIQLPSIGIPNVFTKMNNLLKNTLVGMNLRDVNSELPSGKIQVAEGYVKSKPIPGVEDCFISGRFDFLSQLEDGTYSVIDFKISDKDEEKVQKYSTQLHSYKFAFENPLVGEPKKISKMGLVIISPQEIEYPKDDVIFKTKPKWFEIAENMGEFFLTMAEVSKLLNGPVPPITESCDWCKYRLCFAKPQEEQEEIPF